MNKDIFTEMASRWPSSAVARAEIKKFTGGGISPKSIANSDSRGEGPEGRFFIGRRICYPVNSLIDWLRSHSKILSSVKNSSSKRKEESTNGCK